ncbi:MAG: sulfotransferase family 2 domain-containing protein [Bacteroidota bacterium]
MRISHRYQFIFFANPKTASSSVRQFLNPYTDVQPVLNYLKRTPENPFYPHITPSETKIIFQQLGWDFNSYNKFVFVRNPWTRLVSLYEHIMRNPANHIEFKEWLYSIKPYGIGGLGEDHQRWRKYGAYSIEHFIKDEKGNILVDKVIRFEDINKELKPFLKALGLPNVNDAKLNHSNKRKKNVPYTKYYDENAKSYVRELYWYDIVNYGYTFPEKRNRSIFRFFLKS